MEEFSKSLITIHRTLMLGTVAILAFALSDDPAQYDFCIAVFQ